MSNAMLQALPVVALFIEAMVLGWRIRRGDAMPMAVFNGGVAIALTIVLGPTIAEGPDRWADGLHTAMIAPFVGALAVLATSVAYILRRARLARSLIAAEFAILVLMTAAALAFVVTFRINLEL